MMPIGSAARPFLDYVLSALADAGVGDVCLVLAPDHDLIRNHYDRHPPRRVRVTYAVQERPTGTANAVMAAQAFADDDPFLVLNADNLYPQSMLRALINLDGPGLPGFERDALVHDSAFPSSRLGAFALIEVDGSDHLTAIVEKPGESRMNAAGPRALVSMNAWRFDSRIFEACRDVPASARGEFELPEAVGLSASRGVAYQVVRAHGAVIDLSRRSDVAAVSRRLAAIAVQP
jgi:glucose-1-phosphate thymidylyltransferase